jgi:hypothetical protein
MRLSPPLRPVDQGSAQCSGSRCSQMMNSTPAVCASLATGVQPDHRATDRHQRQQISWGIDRRLKSVHDFLCREDRSSSYPIVKSGAADTVCSTPFAAISQVYDPLSYCIFTTNRRPMSNTSGNRPDQPDRSSPATHSGSRSGRHCPEMAAGSGQWRNMDVARSTQSCAHPTRRDASAARPWPAQRL